MIIKFDHVSYNTNDIEKAKNFFFSLGYEQVFGHLNVRNIPAKRSFMKEESHEHAIYFFRKHLSYNIEIIKHECEHSSDNFLIPMFAGGLKTSLHDCETLLECHSEDYRLYRLKDLNDHYAYLSSNSALPFGFNKLLLYVDDPLVSAAFFEDLGFKKEACTSDLVEAKFTDLTSQQQFYIYLKKRIDRRRVFIDQIGFNCLAFISSSAAGENRRLKRLGYRVTDINRLQLGEKLLDIFFVQGPHLELVEIISHNAG